MIAHLQPDFSVCGNLCKKYSSCSSSWLTMILITWKITAIFFWLKCAFIRKSLSSKVVENADFFLCSVKSFVKYSAVFSEESPYWINACCKISGFTFWSHSDAVWVVFHWSNLMSNGASVLIENPRLPSLKCSRLTHRSNNSKSKSQTSLLISSILA